MKNIFISSTFRDMQAERDLVQEKVLPALREEAKKYGDNVGVIDLRWGVDTSTLETDVGSAKVLTVCLDEIDRSHPYMLIFLGERYGWIPNGSLIEKAVRERGDKYVTDDFEKSVTALEIEYGALSEQYGDLSRCIICFREPVAAMMDVENEAIYAEQDEKGKKKLEELKTRIRKELGYGNRLISYTCKWDEGAQKLKEFTANGKPLDALLTEKYIEMFQPEWEKYKNLSWQEREQLGFKALMESKLRTFVGREALLDEYYERIVNGTQPIILRGEVGSGKTALMSKLIERMQKEGKKVFSFFSGMGAMSKNADSLVQQMIYFVETQVCAEHVTEVVSNDEKKSRFDLHLEYLHTICNKLDDNVFIYIDALDQLAVDEHVEKLDFLFCTEKVQMIASCTDTFSLNSATSVRTKQVEIPMLTMKDAKQVAGGILRAESRDYFGEIERALLEKRSIGSPLYISFLIQRLNMMDQEELAKVNTGEEIAAYGAKVIRDMPETQAEAAVSILKNAIQKISGQTGGLLLEVVRFLAVSRTGLNMDDLRAVFLSREQEIPALDMTVLMKYLDGFFYMGEEDRINFTHKVIREGILNELENRAAYEKEILGYLKKLDKEEMFYVQEGMYFARITKDFTFAADIISVAHNKESKVLLESIIEEAVSDEGAFYSELMSREKENISIIRDYLAKQVTDNLEISQKEMKTTLVLLQSILHYDKEQNTSLQSEESLRNLVSSYNDVGMSYRHMGQSDEVLKYYELCLECAEELYERWPNERNKKLLFVSYDNMGDIFSDLGQLAKARVYYEKGLQHAKELHESEETDQSLRGLFTGYNHMGYVLRELGLLEEALEYCEKGRESAEKVHANQQNEASKRDLFVAYENMGCALRNLGRTEEALACYQKCLMISQEQHEKKQSELSLKDLSIAYINMGFAYDLMGQDGEALGYYENGLKYAEQLYASQQSEASLRELSIAYSSVGRALSDLGKPNVALDYSKKGLECKKELYEKQPNEENARILSIGYNDVGHTLLAMKLAEEALRYYEKGLEYTQIVHKSQSSEQSESDLATCFSNMGHAYWYLHQPNKALEFFEKEVEITEKLCKRQPSDQNIRNLSISYNNMGHALSALKKWFPARMYYEQALKCAEELNDRQQNDQSLEDLSIAYSNVGHVLRDLGQHEESLLYYKKRLACDQKRYKRQENEKCLADLYQSYNNIGIILMDFEEYKKALPYLLLAEDYAKELYEKKGTPSILEKLYEICNDISCVYRQLGNRNEAFIYELKAMKYNNKK